MSKALFDQVSKGEFDKTLATYQSLVGRELIEIFSAEIISYYDEKFELVPNKVIIPIILFFIDCKGSDMNYYVINTEYLLSLSNNFQEEA